MARRGGMQPVYVGDVGDVWTPGERPPLPSDEELDKLDNRQLFAILVEQGVPLHKLIGIDRCIEHQNMVLLGSNKMPDGFNIFEHTKFCRNCFQQFRLKKLP